MEIAKCDVCGERDAYYSAPRGWDAEKNCPASANECLEWAIRDGWCLIAAPMYEQRVAHPETGELIPHADWDLSDEEVGRFASIERRRWIEN